MICENFRSPMITLENLKMRAFPFTVQGTTQDWWPPFVEKFMELSSKKEKPLVNIGKDSTNSVHLVVSIKCKSIPSFNTFIKE